MFALTAVLNRSKAKEVWVLLECINPGGSQTVNRLSNILQACSAARITAFAQLKLKFVLHKGSLEVFADNGSTVSIVL